MQKIDILMVEDEPAIINLYEAFLQLLPYTYMVASSGEEAVLILKDTTFRVCVIDINLKDNGMTGVDLSVFIKDNKKAEKIFAMTGLSYIFDNFDPRIAGFDRVFSKPSDFKPMLKTITDYLKE